jgi:NAD-dependent DNA ligase
MVYQQSSVDSDADIDLEGKVFCLTGVFMAGKRSHVEDILKRSNGLISKQLQKN